MEFYNNYIYVYYTSFAKLRLSAHKLHIETGRYCKERLPPDKRTCSICNNGETEDEYHFIMTCPKYTDLRQNLFVAIDKLYPSFNRIDKNTKFIWLMANADEKIINLVAEYIFLCFQIRHNYSPSE